ncbi:hypothetical protein Tco_0834837 [Tanacetum coccineum]
MSSMGELTFFLGLQVTQKDDWIFISQDKHENAEDVELPEARPKVLHLHAVKKIFGYLKGQPKLGLWYPKDSPFDLEAYTDSDYAGANLDRKILNMRRTNRQESVVPQPRSPTQSPVADEVASTGVDVRYGGATTNDKKNSKMA